MALTRAFKQTVRARVQRDGKYREELKGPGPFNSRKIRVWPYFLARFRMSK
jgi:hypothetical protein